MELFLLLSALIASLTGTARQVVPHVPGMVQAQRMFSDCAAEVSDSATKALSMVRAAVPAPRPDGYVAPEVFAPHEIEMFAGVTHGMIRRRE